MIPIKKMIQELKKENPKDIISIELPSGGFICEAEKAVERLSEYIGQNELGKVRYIVSEVEKDILTRQAKALVTFGFLQLETPEAEKKVQKFYEVFKGKCYAADEYTIKLGEKPFKSQTNNNFPKTWQDVPSK